MGSGLACKHPISLTLFATYYLGYSDEFHQL